VSRCSRSVCGLRPCFLGMLTPSVFLLTLPNLLFQLVICPPLSSIVPVSGNVVNLTVPLILTIGSVVVTQTFRRPEVIAAKGLASHAEIVALHFNIAVVWYFGCFGEVSLVVA